MRNSSWLVFIALAALAAYAPEVRAQSQDQQPEQQPQQAQPSQPIQAYRPPLTSLGEQSEEDNGQNTLGPDNSSLAGAEYLTLGAPKTGYHFWTPYVDLSSTLDSNPLTATGGSGWSTWTTIFGGVNLHRTSGNTDIALSYLGGEAISNEAGAGDSTIQQLGLSDRITFHRSAVMFADQLAYLPEASFGYAGIGGPDLSLGGTVGLQNGFTPSQSILTAFGRRVSNSFVTQFDTFVTPRGTLTFVGSYGVLDYFGSSLNNNKDAVVQGGYSYLLTRKDTIAFIYQFDALRYDHLPQSINANAILVSYARRLTGRMALQLSGGPDVTFSETPITGSPTSTATVTPGRTSSKTRQIFWNLNSSLTYSFKRTSVQATYNHGVTGGSGVLAGALTDNISANVSHQFTRSTDGSWHFGYSRNEGVALNIGSSTTSTGQTYDYWFTGVALNRNLGRSMNLNLGYQVNYQTSNSGFCITATCGDSYLQHQISLTLGWHPGPIEF